MSSGYERMPPGVEQRLSEAPKWAGAAQGNDDNWQRRDARRMIERQLQSINTPLPPGMEAPQFAPPDIRGLIQRLRNPGPQNRFAPPQQEQPTQVAPDPQPEPPPPLRSVLKRDAPFNF